MKLPNEHFIDQQDEADKERITDTNFTVFGKRPKKYHIECESSLPDGRITIRLFEYDAQIALEEESKCGAFLLMLSDEWAGGAKRRMPLPCEKKSQRRY